MTESILKDFMDHQQTERIAYLVMKNFEKITSKELTEDEKEFTIMIAKNTLENYVVERKEDVYVAGSESEEALKDLLEDFTNKLSKLIVHYIYSRLEAYILYKQVKTLEG